jgi:hypothetical protein
MLIGPIKRATKAQISFNLAPLAAEYHRRQNSDSSITIATRPQMATSDARPPSAPGSGTSIFAAESRHRDGDFPGRSKSTPAQAQAQALNVNDFNQPLVCVFFLCFYFATG